MKWISSKDPQDRLDFRRVQGKIRKMITDEKNKSWKKTCSTVKSYLGGKRSTEAWRILNNLRKNENLGQPFKPIPIDKWETYFKGFLTENREPHLRKQEAGVEKNEVEMDNFNLDVKFSGTERLHELLRQIFEHCLNCDEIPNDWKIGRISAIYKKGKKDEYNNYRGITILNIFSRLYGKIMKHFLEQEFFPARNRRKAGFRAGRSTVDHIFCLRQLIKKKMVVNQPIHLLFVDLEKA